MSKWLKLRPDKYRWVCNSCMWVNGSDPTYCDSQRKKLCANCRRRNDAPQENVSYLKAKHHSTSRKKFIGSKQRLRDIEKLKILRTDSTGIDYELGHNVAL